MRVIYSLSDSVASKLRTAADEGGVAGVLEALILAYDELYYAGIIDIDDYERYVEEVHIVDPDDIDEAEYQLQEFFDLCDNIGIFIPVVYEEVSLEEEFNGGCDLDSEMNEGKNSHNYDDIIIAVKDGFETGHRPYDTEEFELFKKQVKEDGITGNYRKLFDKYLELIDLGPSGFYDMYSDKYDFSDEFKQEYADDYEDDSMDESFHGKWEIDTALRIAQEIGLNTLKDLRDFLKNEAKPGESEFDTLLRYRAELGNDFQIKESASLYNDSPEGHTDSEYSDYYYDGDTKRSEEIDAYRNRYSDPAINPNGYWDGDKWVVESKSSTIGRDFNIADPDHPKEQSKYAKSSLNSSLEENYEDEEFDDVDHIDVVDVPEESDNVVKAEPCCQQLSKTVKIGENDIDIGVDFEADDIDA